MIKAVIFDFFGVIALTIMQLVAEKHPLDPQQLGKLSDLHKSLDYGYINDETFLRSYADICGIPQDEFYQLYYSAERYTLSKPILEYADELKLSYKVGLLSNVSGQTYHRLIEPLVGHFDKVVTSYHYRLAKPDVAIFELMANKLGVDVSECVMVDDSEVNCEGARAAGMTAIRYKSLAQLKAELKNLLN